MASLVVLERHLWLNLMEMKVTDKVPFFNSPVSPTGLFGPAVEGFAERFTASLKSSQAMRHFLPKCSSSAAASSLPKMAPTQQPAKASSAVHRFIQTLSPLPLKAFQRMLGLMASVSSVLQLGLLYMRPLQYWLKPRVPPHAWRHGRLRIMVSPGLPCSFGPLEGLSVDGTGQAPGHGALGRYRGLLLRGTLTKPTSEQ